MVIGHYEDAIKEPLMRDIESSALSHPTAPPSSLFEDLSALLDEMTNLYDEPSEIVERCAPVLNRLIIERPEEVSALVNRLVWPSDEETKYTRRRLMESSDGQWSIYAICWRPGQYTPIHDHGTWGVVGVLTGCLFEHQMVCTYEDPKLNIYKLERAGVTLLSRGAVNTFVPEPDHIHRSGVPSFGEPTASLHLYGRVMTHYHAYDLESGTRSRLDVE